MTRKQRKIHYTLTSFLGLILMMLYIKIFRNTIIDIKIPFAIILVTSILTYFYNNKNYQKTYPNYSEKSLIFYTIIYSIISYGFIACSLFLLINYHFAASNTIKKSSTIIERYSLPGSKHHRHERKPVFKINYKGFRKELIFSHNYYKEMDTYSFIEFEARKGFFGFDIIQNKTLK